MSRSQTIWVASAMPGTQDLLEAELRRVLGRQLGFLPSRRDDERHFRCDAAVRRLLSLALCHALHVRRDFPVVRPRGLLSPEHLRAVVDLARSTMALTPDVPFHGFRFDAAGSGSPTFRRLGDAVAAGLGLPWQPGDGDCLITVRPGDDGWQVLCRVGPRPLSTRAWRRADYRGSLNASLAAAMVELSAPTGKDRFLNLMCGSGAILLERLRRGPLTCALGVDDAVTALEAARRNRRHAGAGQQAGLLRADARRLPLASGCFDAVCADLPWGQAHGDAATNAELYGAAFAEAARVCRQAGRFVALTRDTDALARVRGDIEASWRLVDERTFVQRGFRPCCRTYERR